MEPLVLIVYIIIIIAIIVFFAKRMVLIAVCLVATLFIFSVAFRYDGADIAPYAKHFNPDSEKAIVAFFDDFKEKRDKFAVVDTEKVYDSMKEGIEIGKNIIIEGIGTLDINGFAKDMANTLYEAGLKDVDFDALVAEIKDALGITKEEAVAIANQVMLEIDQK